MAPGVERTCCSVFSSVPGGAPPTNSLFSGFGDESPGSAPSAAVHGINNSLKAARHPVARLSPWAASVFLELGQHWNQVNTTLVQAAGALFDDRRCAALVGTGATDFEDGALVA